MVRFAALHALHRCYRHVIQTNGFAPASSTATAQDQTEKVIASWLVTQYSTFQTTLFALLSSEDQLTVVSSCARTSRHVITEKEHGRFPL